MLEVFGNLAPTTFATIGWKYYIVFIVIPSCGLPIIWFYFPETKGITLEEIAALFDEKVAIDVTHMSSEERKQLSDKVDIIEFEGLANIQGQVDEISSPAAEEKH